MKFLILIVFAFVISCIAKRKDADFSYKAFLENEDKRLSKEGLRCSLKKINRKTIENLRLNTQTDVTALCIIKYLHDFPDDGFLWSVLGTLFVSRKEQTNTCFKQAAKLSGKHTAFIQEWNFLGPFGIGKTELDGDPTEAYGGICNVSKSRVQKASVFYSELVTGGEVRWTQYNQKSRDQILKISPSVNWNDLVSSLGSMGITEWQGWIVGDFAVNEDNMNFAVQCLGVSTVHIDGLPYAGDLYHRKQFIFGVALSRGVHTLHIKLRTKVSANFKCLLSIVPRNFEALIPTFLPDLYDGHIFGRHLSIPIANYHQTKWLKNFKVTVIDQSDGDMLEIKPMKNELAIAPGQIKPLHLKILNKDTKILTSCLDIDVEISISTSEGKENLPLKFRCRKALESFLFTFLDHDRSIQHGAAVRPIGSCPGHICPMVLSLHGTTVPPQNQVDSYKKMVGKDYEFGVKSAWLVAPTRHGAHNWEGPGSLTAMAAILSVSEIIQLSSWLEDKADPNHVIFAGHSMGGHGAWHLATHFPDRAIAMMSLAGWIKKEEYGDSNFFFKHDIATSHTDPAVKAIMEACIAENDADRHVSNLQGIPVFSRTGSNDRTVHPYFSRRMYRLLNEYRVPVNYSELEGKEHWWWDTWETNDGGVMNDPKLRDFKARHILAYFGGSCSSDDCSANTGNKYSQHASEDQFTLTTINPAFGEGLRGVRILQQIVPYRTSTIEGHVTEEQVVLTTTNVKRFRIVETSLRKIPWKKRNVQVDEFTVDNVMLAQMQENVDVHICRNKGWWGLCTESVYSVGERGPDTLGPARRVAENHFIIITGTQGATSWSRTLLTAAVYIANQFFLTSDATASIVRDSDVTPETINNRNVILLGGPRENLHTGRVLSNLPLSVGDLGEYVQLEDCRFRRSRTGILTLAPSGPRHLALVLMGLSVEGLLDIVSLATPTIPPMARSPFSNLIPDYVLTGPDFGWKGPGGFLCAGFYGNKWEFRSDITSCVCQE